MIAAVIAASFVASPLFAQAPPPPPPYGPAITSTPPRRRWPPPRPRPRRTTGRSPSPSSIAGGNLAAFSKHRQYAAWQRRHRHRQGGDRQQPQAPTKALQDGIAQGGANLRLLAVKGITPLEGGVPIVVDGKIIGAIGVSGVMSNQDAESPWPARRRQTAAK